MGCVRPATTWRVAAARVQRFTTAMAAALLAAILSGCITGYEKPDFALEVAANYRYAPRSPDRALPALDWWGGFRSRELTGLIEAAQIDNLDISAAIARVVQADAQVKISGAALLPTVDGNAARRAREIPAARPPARSVAAHRNARSTTPR